MIPFRGRKTCGLLAREAHNHELRLGMKRQYMYMPQYGGHKGWCTRTQSVPGIEFNNGGLIRVYQRGMSETTLWRSSSRDADQDCSRLPLNGIDLRHSWHLLEAYTELQQ